MTLIASPSRMLRATSALMLAVLFLSAVGCADTTSDPAPDDGVLGVDEAVVAHPPLPEADRGIGIDDGALPGLPMTAEFVARAD